MLHARNIYLHVYHQFKPNVGKRIANTEHLCRIQYGHQDSEVISDASFSVGLMGEISIVAPRVGMKINLQPTVMSDGIQDRSL